MLRKLLVGLFVVMLLGVLVSGCGKQETKEEGAPKPQQEELAGTITVAGSTSVQPFSEVLAEAFTAQNPKTRVNVQGGGSSQGIEAAKSGAADIGASSRELKPEEKEGMKEFVIARDGIAVAVHPSNPVEGLSVDQIRDIFLGKITNWKQVGGNDAPITVVTREAGSGTRDGFEHLVMNKQPITDKALVANSTGAVKATVAGDKNAIGYLSMAGLDAGVKAIAVDGVKPSKESVKSGEYKVSRPFIYVTKGEPAGLAKAFIEFVLSEEGQKILEDEGAVSIK